MDGEFAFTAAQTRIAHSTPADIFCTKLAEYKETGQVGMSLFI
jgi:hypothetical protein